MRRLWVGGVLVLALAGCTSPPMVAAPTVATHSPLTLSPTPDPAVALAGKIGEMDALHANVCATFKSQQAHTWEECVKASREYLSLAVPTVLGYMHLYPGDPNLNDISMTFQEGLAWCADDVAASASTSKPCLDRARALDNGHNLLSARLRILGARV